MHQKATYLNPGPNNGVLQPVNAGHSLPGPNTKLTITGKPCPQKGSTAFLGHDDFTRSESRLDDLSYLDPLKIILLLSITLVAQDWSDSRRRR